MSEKRFTIKSQDDYWAVVDNYNEDKVCIINGIHTEIEAIWLCDFMNEQQSTIKSKDKQLERLYNYFQDYLKDEMSGNAFSEMWDFVKEDEEWEDEWETI